MTSHRPRSASSPKENERADHLEAADGRPCPRPGRPAAPDAACDGCGTIVHQLAVQDLLKPASVPAYRPAGRRDHA